MKSGDRVFFAYDNGLPHADTLYTAPLHAVVTSSRDDLLGLCVDGWVYHLNVPRWRVFEDEAGARRQMDADRAAKLKWLREQIDQIQVRRVQTAQGAAEEVDE